ncbi:MAG: hypothetical protein ACK58T_48255, partial [Phycisphaerae bacterium]
MNLTDDTATGAYYASADTTCVGAPITTASLASGTSVVNVRYRDDVKENVVLTVADNNAGYLAGDTFNLAVGPRTINITGTTPIRANECTLYTATTRDQAGTAAGVLVSTQINLTDATATGNFYAAADTTCSGGTIANITLGVGVSSGTFRWKDTVGATRTLTGTDNAALLVAGTMSVVVGPDRLDIAGTTPQRSGDCNVFSITSRDTALNAVNTPATVTVNLTDDTATGAYYASADTTCVGAPITTASLASGTSVVNVRYRD